VGLAIISSRIEDGMPIVRVNMFEGRSVEQKRELAEKITRAIVDVCGVSPADVHVLLEEMERENWSRGNIINSDRLKHGRTSPQEIAYISFSDVETFSDRRDEYLTYRKENVHPTMAKMPGFQDVFVAQDLTDDDKFVLLIRWDSEASQVHYQGTPEHDELKAKIRGELVSKMDMQGYSLLDFAYGGNFSHGEPQPYYLTLSTHNVKPEKVNAYLEYRRAEIHPVMASFEGFVSSSVLLEVGSDSRFLIVNQWLTEEGMRAYGSSTLHDSLRGQVHPLLTETPVNRRFKVMVL
jgi:4-oxalocrotonate tautomerase